MQGAQTEMRAVLMGQCYTAGSGAGRPWRRLRLVTRLKQGSGCLDAAEGRKGRGKISTTHHGHIRPASCRMRDAVADSPHPLGLPRVHL